jgi:hypothetical protein
LTEPSLKVAVAFNWVALPMATAGWEGLIATDTNSAVVVPFVEGNAAIAPVGLAILSVALAIEWDVAAGRCTAATDK